MAASLDLAWAVPGLAPATEPAAAAAAQAAPAAPGPTTAATGASHTPIASAEPTPPAGAAAAAAPASYAARPAGAAASSSPASSPGGAAAAVAPLLPASDGQAASGLSSGSQDTPAALYLASRRAIMREASACTRGSPTALSPTDLPQSPMSWATVEGTQAAGAWDRRRQRALQVQAITWAGTGLGRAASLPPPHLSPPSPGGQQLIISRTASCVLPVAARRLPTGGSVGGSMDQQQLLSAISRSCSLPQGEQYSPGGKSSLKKSHSLSSTSKSVHFKESVTVRRFQHRMDTPGMIVP